LLKSALLKSHWSKNR